MSDFDQILEGMNEALAHAKGEDIGPTEHVVRVEVPDVAQIRRSLGLSQVKFAAAFDVSLGTLRGWEQGRRRPSGTARVLLQVIEREPEAVRRALALDSGDPRAE